MTSIDKLNKSFEFLKIPTQLYNLEQRKQDVKQLNKKDKINHLNLIHENIISPNIRQTEDYSRLLSLAIEAFLVLFDDEDQDVYFVAEECLNKTIKALIDTNLTRFPADLYRFLRRNGTERSLRGALVRFAELCHMIKPHKCRIYVDFIIKENTLSKIANRTEESIQSVLVSSMNKICSAFCWSMTDNEIKILIQSFLPNLSNDSSVNSYRRVSANCLSIICLYSRSPYGTYYYLHQELLSLILPLDESNQELNKFTVWGVLLCFRYMIIHLAELDKSASQSSAKSKSFLSPSSSSNLKPQSNAINKLKSSFYFNLLNLCQVYEICVYYLNNDDIRLVNASLECLQVLLKLAPFRFASYLTKTGHSNQTFLQIKRKSKMTNSMDSLSTLKLEDSITEEESQPIKSICDQIGSFYDPENPPALYLIRLLAYKFLLSSNEPGTKLKSDGEVKILVKASALDCCSSILSLCPQLIFKTLFLDSSYPHDLYISDLIEYINHAENKMRTNASILIGQLINSILLNKSGDFDSWLAKYAGKESLEKQFKYFKLEILVDYLMRFIRSENNKQTNNICKRFALSSLRSFLPTLVKTHHSSYSLEILINLIHLKHSTYNLVKCELVDLLASIDFKSVCYVEQELGSKSVQEDSDDEINSNPFVVRNTQERIIEEVFLYLLGSEDSKVRLETARSLTRFVLNMNFYEVSSIQNQNLLLAAGEHSLKSDGYAPNFLNSSLIDNDAHNLGSINNLFDKTKSNQTQATSVTSSTSFVTPASILHGSSTNSKRQIKYSCSPLSAVSFNSSLPWLSKTNQILLNNFIQPFHSLIKYWPTRASNTGILNNNLNKIVEHNLAYLVPILVKSLIESIDKYQFLGCLETLDFIFQTYQPALYYSNDQQLIDLLNLFINYLKHSNVSFDLYAHDIVTRLIGNLFSAFSWLNMKKLDKKIQQLNFNLNNSTNQNIPLIQSSIESLNSSIKTIPFAQSLAELSTGLNYTYSFSFNNQQIKPCIDQLFVHVMKMLCVLACVIDESSLPSNLTTNLSAGSTAVTAPPPPTPAPSLAQPEQATNIPQTPTSPTNPGSASPSFIRAKFSNLTDPKLIKNSSNSSLSSGSTTNTAQTANSKEPEAPTSLPKTTNNIYLGFFQNSSHYLKLYELIRTSYNSYKKSSSINTYDRFTQIIKTTLNLLAQLLEASLSVHEIGPHLDEILLYLRIIFTIEPSCSVKCVTLCLKSLFSLNLAGLMFEYIQQQVTRAQASPTPNSSTLQLPVPISGLSSVISTSMTSLTSFNQPSAFNQLNTWSTNSKRQQTSLFSSLIQNNLAQFTRFMYSQTLMFKNDLNIQFNPNSNLLNIGLDSIEYITNSTISTGPTMSTSSQSSSTSTTSTTSNTPTVKTVAKVTPFSSGFNLFNFMKKKETTPAASAPQTQTHQGQQPQQIDQKLKQQKTDLKTIAQYIKSFESIVIKSLRQYTLTTSVNLQTKILELLTHLIFLKVDYCLLDSDKVFIDYVLKQFEYLEQKRVDEPNDEIENGANLLAKSYSVDLYEHFDTESSVADPLNPFDLDTMLNKLYSTLENSSSSPITSILSLRQQEHQRTHVLIPKLFDFLILLSHEKKPSPPSPNRTPMARNSGLLSIPEIMQLCDNLIASENSPHTHAIPALTPLVMDLFLNRTNEDSRELDMQHDVIMMTMLRLIQYPSVWPLLTIAGLKYKRDSEEKWKKASRQICDSLFDAMRSQNANLKLKFFEYNGNELRAVRRYSPSYITNIESLKHLFQLFNSLAPQVFRPIDFILLSLFETLKPLFKQNKLVSYFDLNNYLCLLMTHIYLLLTNSNEDQILIRLHHLTPQIVQSYKDAEIIMSTRQKSSRKNSLEETVDDLGPISDNGSSYFLDSDEIDFDVTDSALFLSKFLLKILEISFQIIKDQIKFNGNSYFSAQNLASTSTAAFLRDSELNLLRDSNIVQHLIANKLLFLLYIINSGNYLKLANAITNLVVSSTNKPKDNVEKEDFDFNSANFLFDTNKFILFKLSKVNAYLSSMWQYFLVLCNYQDQEYWLSCLETTNQESDSEIENGIYSNSCQDFLDLSANSSANNSLNPSLQDQDQMSTISSAKLLRSKIRSQNNYQIAKKSLKDNNSSEKNTILFYRHLKYPSLNEQLFKYLSLTIYCDNITTRNQLDNTTALTMVIINNIADLFELSSHESTVLDLFSTIHRNASASSLFIHSINLNWSNILAKKKIYLLHSCLKSLEGVHLASSGHLLNLLIEKFFSLPYLSLVRYADHIACQRVEMMQSLTPNELATQLSEQHLKILDSFFNEQFKYSYRHQRLISLLEQLKKVITNFSQGVVQNNGDEAPSSPLENASFFDKTMKMSPSIDFFMLYVNSNQSVLGNLDKEWYYNIVRSACCYSNPGNDLISDSSALKSKQCALILSNLDFSNSQSILNDKTFRLNILKDCLLIGANRTQKDIQKLPSALKKAKNLQKDFMHPLWLASTQFLFGLLKNLSSKLPKPVCVSLSEPAQTRTRLGGLNSSIYEQKLNDLIYEYDFYSFISPVTESINAFLKSIRQYPCLEQQISNENLNYIIDFILFQMSFVNYISIQKLQVLTLESLNQSFLSVFNLLVEQQLLGSLCQHSNFSTFVSYLIKDLYQLLIYYFFKIGDENLINTPVLSAKSNIDYVNGQKYTNDVLFNTITLETLLKLRFIITNPCSSSSNPSENAEGSNDSFRVSSNTHQFLQLKSQFFREKIPFNMRDLIEKIYIGLCRLPILERFIRIPDSLWRTPGFNLEYGQFLKTDTSTLPPLDYLRDPQILKEHLKHILLVGWTTRTQFEFEYVNMLTFFHNLSEDYYLPMSSNAVAAAQASISSNASVSSDDAEANPLVSNLPTEEIKERNKCICLLIKGLSSWLIKSSLTPKSGNTLNSLCEQVSRNKYPSFLQTQLGKQYGQVKRVTDQFNRYNLFTKLNSISISNNSNLLYMLDPTLIDDLDRTRKKLNTVALDFTQPQPPDSLSNLVKISTSLRQGNQFNLLFSTNIERLMLNNLPTNSDSYFYFTQISLEGILKFLGQWNKNVSEPKVIGATIGESIQNLVNSTNLTSSNLIDEVSAGIIKVAEYLSEDTDLLNTSEENPNSSNEVFQTNNNYLVQRSFNRNSLDLTSVLRTVLDYYESFFKIPSLQLKLEIFKSMLYLSNCLFDSKQQYESLIQKLQFNFDFMNLFIQQENDLILMPTVNELVDESTLALAIYAECLCRCCLQTSKETSSLSGKDFERLNKLIENGLKSNSVPIKVATIHGLMYWLELITLGYISNTNDAKQLIDHLCKQIYQMKDVTVYLVNNSRFISTLWSAVFYTIENCLDSIRDAQNFCATFIKLTYGILNDTNTPYFLFYQLYMGLERFLLSSMVPSFEINTIQRLFSSKLYDEQRSLCLISLTVTSLYASNQSKQINYWNDIIAQQYKTNSSNMPNSHSGTILNSEISSPNSSVLNSPINPENPLENQATIGYPQILELTGYPELQSHLLKVLEVATNFLDRMKSSSTSKEASLYASLLPKILCDFLPPHDLLNKLITEFLNSSQHPYPEAVAYVLYKCFDLLQEKCLQSQIQEWCLLSLSNFLQRTSIYESIWLTSCLLVSATQNQWLKSTFPFLLNRYCAFQTIDRAIFYMSVIEFRKQFNDKAQIQSIYSTFEAVAKPGTPYEELIKLLNSQESDSN